MRDTLRLKYMNLKTEKSYEYYIKKFILFHNQCHPREMGTEEIRAYLSHLAVNTNVAASTQDVRTTMIYTYVLNRGGRGDRSSLDL